MAGSPYFRPPNYGRGFPAAWPLERPPPAWWFAKQFSGRTTAVCAGAVFAILPRVTWAGIEARSSALSVAAAVWLTVLLVAAVRCNTQRRWLLYALVLMLSILVSINLALLVPAYATMVPLLASGKSRKSPVIWWTVVTAAALGAMTPFILFAHGQVWQVGWIAGLNRNIILDVIHRQYFDHSVPFAILAGLIVAAGIAAHLAGARGPGGDTHRLVLVSAAWIVVPTAVVLIYSATVEPIYYPRYLILHRPRRGRHPGGLRRHHRPQAVAHRRGRVSPCRRSVSNYFFTQRGRTRKRAGITARWQMSSAPMPSPGIACWWTTPRVGDPGPSAPCWPPGRRRSGR